ncbi:MAG: osmotically inducible protein OsmC [Magnetovibrio sp.]|nr:osmotically inducible protein OsmC [Magnetovibrio sp.]
MNKSDRALYAIDFYNGIFEQSRDAIKKGKVNNPLQVRVESESQGGFESCVKIRNFEFSLDQPQSFGGTNKGPKPSEVLLASLAACQEVTWRLYASANGIPLTAIRVELNGVQDLRGFLNINDDISVGFQYISGTVTIESPAGEKEINHLKEIVDSHCPVLDDLRRPLKVDMKLEYAFSEE